jgi:hypothetical protein
VNVTCEVACKGKEVNANEKRQNLLEDNSTVSGANKEDQKSFGVWKTID